MRVRAGGAEWWTDAAPPSSAGDRPALVALDAQHLLVLYTVGTDPSSAGSATVSRLRVAVLSTANQGLFQAAALGSSFGANDDPSLSQRRPRATRVGDRIYAAWERDLPADAPEAFELVLRQYAWSPTTPAVLDELAEHRLATTAPSRGDQRNPALASSALFPDGALISAWEDQSGQLASQPSAIVLGLRPSPIVELDPSPGEM